MIANMIRVEDAQVSEDCVEVVKHFEQGPGGGHAKTKYKCPAGLWTIGWGHVIRPMEKFPVELTLEMADDLLYDDLDRFDEEVKDVLLRWGVEELEQCQYDALVCLAFNTGVGIKDGRKGDFADSTLLQYISTGQMLLAAGEFSKWVYSGKRVLDGLVRRRKCEKHLFQWGEVKFFINDR